MKERDIIDDATYNKYSMKYSSAAFPVGLRGTKTEGCFAFLGLVGCSMRSVRERTSFMLVLLRMPVTRLKTGR